MRFKRALKAFSESVAFADKLDRGVVQNHHGNGADHTTASAVAKRGPKPQVPARTSINDYHGSELIELIRWIASDGQLRTDDQIIDEIVPELGFSRRGVRIETAIRSAIALWRSHP
jgi:hypothetical protein